MKVRLAGADDTEDILRWRNDEITRAMSRNTEFVDWDTHVAWFNKTLTNPERLIYIGVLSGQKIGMVRFDRQVRGDDVWEVSIVMAPEQRAKGLGRGLLAASISYFLPIYPGTTILAEVKKGNVASWRVFESAGFVRREEHGADMFKFVLFRKLV